MIDSATLHASTAESIHFAAPGEIEEIREALAPLRVVEIRDHIASDGDLFARIAAVLKFPDYFGQNWDAVDESLRDLGWLDVSDGLVLVIANSDRLWTTNARLAGQLVEVWLAAVEEWRVAEVPFHLVFEW